MKTRILIAFILILSIGCASLKYSNWEEVNIENSVDNKPCVLNGTKEKCINLKDVCVTWFKKRATLVNANTTVIHGDPSNTIFNGRYFQCKTGLPLYKGPRFNKEEYKSGSNTVTGQAFLTKKEGGVVTCAGLPVQMYPDTEYFSDMYGSVDLANQAEAAALIKSSQCDAQGNFEFHNVPAGKWIISVIVSYDVLSVKSIGNFYYYTAAGEKQGGPIKKQVTVQNGGINKFIISQ
jgi:hypothetical protein